MIDTFADDIKKGLLSRQKYLPSKYFYDDNGSRIFQEIMKMPEYYPTDAEFEVLSLQAGKIFDALQFSQPFNILELGPGDGFKTFKLLEYLVNNKVQFNYVPIDISSEAIEELTKRLAKRLPGLVITPQIGDYFEVLKTYKASQNPNLLLFLGGNIGNYKAKEVKNLLGLFNRNMKNGDKLLVGIDLKKNPLIIHNAYFDPHGITKRFNLNLLIRMNRELGADFKLDDFDFYCHYNPATGEVRSYLVSLKEQMVNFSKIDFSVQLKQNELIWTELSKKYTLDEIEALANTSQFKLIDNFLDCKHHFTDSLWAK